MKYQAIKEEITKLALQQVNLKPQRKTSNFKGVRQVESYDAVIQHSKNRYKLRHLYMAYAILRGVERPAPKRGIYYKSDVKAYVDKFSKLEEEVIS